MKVLVIYPKDRTTDFLSPTVLSDFTVIRTDISDSTLKKLIRQHDVIIMMGHGDEKGLFGFDKYIINSDFVDELRKKICICIWCHASDFVKKYDLKTPFSTGMFISETEEAYLEGVMHNKNDIEDSNYWFTDALQMYFLQLEEYKFADLVHDYTIEMNNIIHYNVKQFYKNI